jgi:SRSO17 transposase
MTPPYPKKEHIRRDCSPIHFDAGQDFQLPDPGVAEMSGPQAVSTSKLDQRSSPPRSGWRPPGSPGYLTKPEIELAEIDRNCAAGVRFGCVLADAGHGLSAPFRQGLSERGLTWAVGIPYEQKVYPAGVAMIFLVAGRGRPGQRHIPDAVSFGAQAMLERAKWQTVSWRRRTKGRLSARFSALRVRVAVGTPAHP